MIKQIAKGIAVVVAAVIIILALIIGIYWSRIPSIISSRLSAKMKVPVEIDGMTLGYNEIDVKDILIGNPPGSMLRKAFYTRLLEVEAPLKTYLQHDIVIDRIELSDVYVGLEFDSKNSKTGNWTTIVNNLQSNSEEKKPGKRVLIKKLILTNINIDLAYRQERELNRLSPIARLEFDNLNSEEGIPYDEITKIIMREMLKKIFSIENIQNMVEDFVRNSGSLRGIFGVHINTREPFVKAREDLVGDGACISCDIL